MPNPNDTMASFETTGNNITHPVGQSLAPVTAENRLDVMDILRGFALFGILLMNIEYFNIALSNLGHFDASQTGGNWTASWLIKVFVEGKFYKLFSLLFGMGFAIMLIRAQQTGRPFVAWFVRRMLVLFVVGLLHMVLLWGGDILHDYAVGGLLLLAWICLIRRPRWQRFNSNKWFLRISLGMIVLPMLVTLIAGLGFGAFSEQSALLKDWHERQAVVTLSDQKLQQAKQNESVINNDIVELQRQHNQKNFSERANQHVDADRHIGGQSQPADSGLAAFPEDVSVTDSSMEPQEKDPEEMTPDELIEVKSEERFDSEMENWRDVEQENNAFTQPNYWVATEYRAKTGFMQLKYTPVFLLVMGFPLFMLGYWFIASGVMTHIDQHLVLFKAMTWLGVGFGLSMSVAGMLIDVHPAAKSADEIKATAQSLFFFGQNVLAAGYLGAMVLLVHNLNTRRYLLWLAPMGRMALTNYILHSVILSSIFYGYGAGLYGQVGRLEQVGMAVIILVCQAFISRWWLTAFRFGPLEWCWRCLTYMQWQKFRV